MEAAAFTARTSELETLGATWSRVCSAHPETVVISGPPASGKSRLIAEALAGLDPRPDETLIGHAGWPAPAPYDWFATAMRGRQLHDLPVAPDILAWLTHSGQPAGRWEPTALLRAAVEAVRHLTSRGPSVLVAEDFQALDPASLALITHLTVLADSPILLLVATRNDTPMPAAQTQLLQTLADRTWLRLAPVTTSDIADTEAVWARYAHTIGRHHEAAVAALRGAAAHLAAGEHDQARRLINDCLPGDGLDADTDVQLLLAQALLRLGHTDQAEQVAGRLEPDDAAQVTDTLRSIGELTARERQVLSCLAAGMSNRHIGRSLNISVRTVGVHVSNLLRKTGTGSRTEAALWAVQHGLDGQP